MPSAASDRCEFESLPLSGWAMKPEQVRRRVRQRVCDTVHDVSREDGLSGFRVAPQGAFKKLLMLRRCRLTKDHGDHQIADVFVENRGVRVEQHAGAARGQ